MNEDVLYAVTLSKKVLEECLDAANKTKSTDVVIYLTQDLVYKRIK